MTIDMVSIALGSVLGLTLDREAQLELGGMRQRGKLRAEKPRAVFEKLGVASSRWKGVIQGTSGRRNK